MKVYLDECAIQRPLDTPDQIRIRLEAEAVLGILTLCEQGQLVLVSSEAFIFENERNPLYARREHGRAVIAQAKIQVGLNTFAEQRAAKLLQAGLKPLDALHLALAEIADVDYFCTCDDRLMRQARRISDLRLRVVSPIELIQVLEGEEEKDDVN